MSANSSGVDVDGGGGSGVDGSALAVPKDSAQAATRATTADTKNRFVTSLASRCSTGQGISLKASTVVRVAQHSPD
jgi:hypothetical protein